MTRYSIAPTAFGPKKGQSYVALNGPFLNQIFFNIRRTDNKGIIGEYIPSNFYSFSIGVTDFLSTSIGFNPGLMILNGMFLNNEYRYLPIFTNTKLHFEAFEYVSIGGGLFTFNLPSEGSARYGLFGSGSYDSEVLWQFIPNQSTRDSSFIALPYGVVTIGNKRNNFSIMYSPYHFFNVSGKLKLRDNMNIMSEHFFINGRQNNVRFNSLTLGFFMSSSIQLNGGVMYMSPFAAQDKYPFMLSYSAVFKVDTLRSKKRNPKHL